MGTQHEEFRSGLDHLATITELMQRVRNAHPTDGLYETAEVQFWWSIPRRTDSVDQLFWFDDDRPIAAAFVTDFSNGSSLVYDAPTFVTVTMPGATADWVAHVIERGLAHVAACGIDRVEVEVEQRDDVTRELLAGRGFNVTGSATVECWLAADDRPPVSPLAGGYRLLSRADSPERPHHMADDRRPDIERRLREASLYRADLDLAVFDEHGDVGGYGMFWLDPVTATGVVEPMRTLDDHQQKGLARHILTTGVERLAAHGARRISIGYEPDNAASGHLYRSVGFVPHQYTDLMAGPTQ